MRSAVFAGDQPFLTLRTAPLLGFTLGEWRPKVLPRSCTARSSRVTSPFDVRALCPCLVSPLVNGAHILPSFTFKSSSSFVRSAVFAGDQPFLTFAHCALSWFHPWRSVVGLGAP